MSVKTTGCVDLCNKLMLTHDAGIVVLQHLATTQERVRVCRSVSKECRCVLGHLGTHTLDQDPG